MAWTTPGTATAGEVLTAAFWNAQVRDNFIELDDLAGAWKSWTPAARTGINTALVTEVAKYIQVGKTIWFRYSLTLTGAAITGSVSVRGPLPNGSGNSHPIIANFGDDGTGDRPGYAYFFGDDFYINALRVDGTYATGADLSATVPFTWASNDRIRVFGCYETT